jgi:hypothetical protein
MIGDNVIIDHAYYQGLYLILINRTNLEVVFKQSYNTIEGQGLSSEVGARENVRPYYNETLYGNVTDFFY